MLLLGRRRPEPRLLADRPRRDGRAGGGAGLAGDGDWNWICEGDFLHLCFDTLDSRYGGRGGDVYGTLELPALADVHLRYVDFGDSKGRRNTLYEQKLPVVLPTAVVVAERKGD